MSEWGDGPFDNDVSADWVDELDDADDKREYLLASLNRDSRLSRLEGFDVRNFTAAVATVAMIVDETEDFGEGPECLADLRRMLKDDRELLNAASALTQHLRNVCHDSHWDIYSPVVEDVARVFNLNQ